MSLTYATNAQQLANLMAADAAADPFFAIMLPGAIDYAEQRIYRELDLQFTIVTDATASTTPSTRTFTLPPNTASGFVGSTFIVLNDVNLITPAGTPAATGARTPLVPVSQSVLDMAWPAANANTGAPQLYCRPNSTTLILGPSPDAAYVLEVIGTQRPQPLTSVNTTTILTTYVPDLFQAAEMVYASGYMRNFGAQSDDPRLAASWESQYQSLMKSAAVEQFRAKFQSQGYTSQTPSPIAAPRT